MYILDACNAVLFKYTFFIEHLKILAVSISPDERLFLTKLKPLKTLLRNKTGNERSTGLAVLFVHWKYLLYRQSIENCLIQKKKKKL
jgi:hypothetical protein